MNLLEARHYIGPVLDCLFYIKKDPQITADEWDEVAGKEWCAQPQDAKDWYEWGVEHLIDSVKRELQKGFVQRHMLAEKEIHKELPIDPSYPWDDLEDEEDEEDLVEDPIVRMINLIENRDGSDSQHAIIIESEGEDDVSETEDDEVGVVPAPPAIIQPANTDEDCQVISVENKDPSTSVTEKEYEKIIMAWDVPKDLKETLMKLKECEKQLLIMIHSLENQDEWAQTVKKVSYVQRLIEKVQPEVERIKGAMEETPKEEEVSVTSDIDGELKSSSYIFVTFLHHSSSNFFLTQIFLTSLN